MKISLSPPLRSVLLLCLSLLLCDCVLADNVKKGYTDVQRKQLLDAHNDYRRQIAKKFGASNMRLMEWHCGLEDFMWRHLQTLKASCKLKHSTDEDIKDDKQTGYQGPNSNWAGENLGGTWDKSNWTGAANSWYKEIKDWKWGKGTPCAPNKACGHFTQMIWADSWLLGCSGVKCDKSELIIVGCVYAPTGNYQHMYPLKKGTPCVTTKGVKGLPNAPHQVDGLCSASEQVNAFPVCANSVDIESDNTANSVPMLGPNLTVMLLYMCLYATVVVLE